MQIEKNIMNKRNLWQFIYSTILHTAGYTRKEAWYISTAAYCYGRYSNPAQFAKDDLACWREMDRQTNSKQLDKRITNGYNDGV